MSPPSDFFERVKFSLTYTEIPWLVKLSLTGKRFNFPGTVTHFTLNCEEIRNTDVLFEYWIGSKIGGQQFNKLLLCLTSKTQLCLCIRLLYFTWDGFGEVNVMKIVNCKRKFCSVRILFTNFTLPYMSHIIGVLNCSLWYKTYCKTHCCLWCKGWSAVLSPLERSFLTCTEQIV